MKTITIFLLCYLAIAKAFVNVNINSNIRVNSQVNVQSSGASNSISNSNTVVNSFFYHGSQPSSVDSSKNDKSEATTKSQSDKGNKRRHVRKPGELSQKKCKEYYPSVRKNQTLRRKRQTQSFRDQYKYYLHPLYYPYTTLNEPSFSSWEYIPTPPGIHAMFSGMEIYPKQYSHMALIGLVNDAGFDRWICGGSLISHNFVLTAAHCLISQKLIIRLGELDTSTQLDAADPHDFSVKKSFPHPEYKKSRYYNDIGLLELEKPVTLSEYIGIACLDGRREIDQTEMLTITGWGESQRKAFNNYMLKANVFATPYDVCKNGYRTRSSLPLGIVDDTQICAVGPNKEDACKGDSGGPLQTFHGFYGDRNTLIYKIIGITSIGMPCGYASADRPGVYTRVHHYLSWIESVVWPSE